MFLMQKQTESAKIVFRGTRKTTAIRSEMILTYKNGNSQFIHGLGDVCEVVIDDSTIGCYHNGERVTISSRDAWEHYEQDPNLGKCAEHGYSSMAREYHNIFCYHKWVAEYEMEHTITPVSNI